MQVDHSLALQRWVPGIGQVGNRGLAASDHMWPQAKSGGLGQLHESTPTPGTPTPSEHVPIPASSRPSHSAPSPMMPEGPEALTAREGRPSPRGSRAATRRPSLRGSEGPRSQGARKVVAAWAAACARRVQGQRRVQRRGQRRGQRRVQGALARTSENCSDFTNATHVPAWFSTVTTVPERHSFLPWRTKQTSTVSPSARARHATSFGAISFGGDLTPAGRARPASSFRAEPLLAAAGATLCLFWPSVSESSASSE
eukprot:scaffold125745_cov45-Phaeocystis_antarctica.AAC.1